MYNRLDCILSPWTIRGDCVGRPSRVMVDNGDKGGNVPQRNIENIFF